MITANEVKSTLRSLRAKINKETGKEHATIAEGVEDLVLGYGIGQGEAWDGKIYVNGEIAKDVKDYFEEGRQAGINEAGKVIYGAFSLRNTFNLGTTDKFILSQPEGAYGRFYDCESYLEELIGSIEFNSDKSPVVISNQDLTKTIWYDAESNFWNWKFGEETGEITSPKAKIFEFTSPVLVSIAFFGAFISVFDVQVDDAVSAALALDFVDVSLEGQ